MPMDPVYEPLPSSSSVWKPTFSIAPPHSPVPGNFALTEPSSSSWVAMSAGFVAGAVAGVAIALVFAPRRGAEVRSTIRQYAADRGERLSRSLWSGRSSGSTREHATLSPDAARSGPQPLTASVADLSEIDRRFEEPLGG